jgi:hypothetical protein
VPDGRSQGTLREIPSTDAVAAKIENNFNAEIKGHSSSYWVMLLAPSQLYIIGIYNTPHFLIFLLHNE